LQQRFEAFMAAGNPFVTALGAYATAPMRTVRSCASRDGPAVVSTSSAGRPTEADARAKPNTHSPEHRQELKRSMVRHPFE